MRSVLLWWLIFWPVSGYALSPVPAEIYVEIDHGLRPAKVLADPVGYRGRTLLLGGVVERTVSEPGRVSLEIVCYGLTEDDRPEAPDPALGRVMVTGSGLDGARLQPGRQVTLVAVAAGWMEAGSANLPLFVASFMHPWPTAAEEEAARELLRWPGSYDDPWCDPWSYDHWCDPWYYGPYPRWRFGGSYYRHWH